MSDRVTVLDRYLLAVLAKTFEVTADGILGHGARFLEGIPFGVHPGRRGKTDDVPAFIESNGAVTLGAKKDPRYEITDDLPQRAEHFIRATNW